MPRHFNPDSPAELDRRSAEVGNRCLLFPTFAFACGRKVDLLAAWRKGLIPTRNDGRGRILVTDIRRALKNLAKAGLVDMGSEPNAPIRVGEPADTLDAEARKARLLDLNLAVLAARRKLDQVRADNGVSLKELRDAMDEFCAAEDALAAEYRQR